MPRALLVTNPAAARSTPGRSQSVYRLFRALGWQVDLAETAGPGDARRLAAAGVDAGVDVVVVLGGDGTMMQAAAALVGSDVALGIVPGGTGNLLAGNLRIPSLPVPAAHTIARGRSRWIDLGRVERDNGVHYFAVACGAGADAAVMLGTEALAKRRWGIGGYFATLFREVPRIRSVPTRITVDGASFEARSAMALVLNCGELIPPLVRVRQGAALDDGVFDVIVLTADTPWECARGFWRTLQNVVAGTGPTAYLAYARGQEVRIEPATAQPVQFDGEAGGTTPVAVTIVPRAIRVMVP